MPGLFHLFFLLGSLVLLSAETPPPFPSVFDEPVPECNCTALVNDIDVRRAIRVEDWETKLDKAAGWFESGMEYLDSFHADVTRKVHVFSSNADQQLASWGGRETEEAEHEVSREGNASEGMADYFNRLFHDDTYLYSGEASYLIIRLGVEFNKEAGEKFLNKVRFAMKLPYTQDQLQIFVGDPLADKNKDLISETGKVDDTTGVGARYFVPEVLKNVKTSVSAGLRGITNPFAQGRIEYPVNYYDWLIRPVQYVDYSAKRQFYEETDLYFDRRISKEEMVRLQLQRSTQTEKIGMNYVAALFYFNTRRFGEGFRSYVSMTGQTKVHDVNTSDPQYDGVEMKPGIYSYSIGGGWKASFLRSYLFYEVEPRVDFDMVYDWRPNYVVRFWLEVYFGDT